MPICLNESAKRPKIVGGDLKAVYNRVVKGEIDYTASSQKTLDKYGGETIVSILVRRTPVSVSGVINGLKAVNKQFKKNIENKSYDELFHLFLVCKTASGIELQVEKEAVIVLTSKPPAKKEGTEEAVVKNVPKNMTLQSMLEKTEASMGDSNYWSYDAIKNNCQSFLIGIMTANNFGGTKVRAFVKQDVSNLFGKTAQKAIKGATSLGGVFETLVN